MIRAHEIASGLFIKVSKDESIKTCGNLMGNSGKKYVVVMDGDEILGVIQNLQIIKKLTAGELTSDTKAKDLMVSLISVDKNMDMHGVIYKMIEFGVSQIAVDNKIIDKDLLLEYIYNKKE
ncbi:hypothetical protein HZA55_08455 [Candidatus Poribacteria bacterium]|nr:hypothetical protein [Candidatus Poribacteria bacterium]